jgi:DNA-binding MarR family transcriptional regulator
MISQPVDLPEVLREWSGFFMHHYFSDFKRFMDQSGLSLSQIGTLIRLYHCRECGVTDISQHLGITKAAASQLVDRLVQQGLLERAEDPKDRRFKLVTITEQGRTLITGSIENRQKWLFDLTVELTEDEKRTIADVLTTMIAAMRKLEEDTA